MNDSSFNESTNNKQSPLPDESAIDDIVQALRGLRFGQVTIVVQDGVVVQIERTEKRRLRRRPVE